MVNGKWLPDFIERLKASAWHQLYLPLLPFTHARSESINADSLKLQLLTARKKEWWPATADSLPQAVYLTTVKHTATIPQYQYRSNPNLDNCIKTGVIIVICSLCFCFSCSIDVMLSMHVCLSVCVATQLDAADISH